MREECVLPHKLVLNERKLLTVTGVTEVVSFDDASVIAQTELGTLMVQGDGLQLKTLLPEGGQVTVEGHIVALIYHRQQQERSWWSRLFH